MNASHNRPAEPADDPTGTRGNLIAAARRCIATNGLAGATSREITSQAGANLASITYHFGSKDELIAEALFSELEARIRPALACFDQPGDPTMLLMQSVQQLLETFERSKADAPVYLEALMLATRDTRYRASALRLYRTLRSRLADLITQLIADEVIPTSIEPEAMASLILAVGNGIALQASLDPRGPDPAAMASQFAGLLLARAAASG
jgi:AcrR family transcriptional regulator